MAILPIITAPDPILKQKSLPVSSVDDDIKKLMDDMYATMLHDGGAAGLAAVQVGVLKQVIVLDMQTDDEIIRPEGFYPLYIANPLVIETSSELTSAFEGCLSVPQQRIEVTRPKQVTIKYINYHNEWQVLSAEGWLARCIQHEIDHLNGKLLIEYLSRVKKDVAERKLQKLKKYAKVS